MSSWSLASAVSPTVTGSAAGDVIRLNNLKAASDIDIATASDSKQQQRAVRPTTPVPAKKLTSKRPPHLTLHIKPSTTTATRTTEAHEAPLAETENVALSCSSSVYGTPLGSAAALAPAATPGSQNTSSSTSHSSNSTASSIFPHEQYKTIKKIDIQFDNVKHSAKFGFFRRGKSEITI